MNLLNAVQNTHNMVEILLKILRIVKFKELGSLVSVDAVSSINTNRYLGPVVVNWGDFQQFLMEDGAAVPMISQKVVVSSVVTYICNNK